MSLPKWVKSLLSLRIKRKQRLQQQLEEVDVSEIFPDTPSTAASISSVRSFDSLLDLEEAVCSSNSDLLSSTPTKRRRRRRSLFRCLCVGAYGVTFPAAPEAALDDDDFQPGQPVAERSLSSRALFRPIKLGAPTARLDLDDAVPATPTSGSDANKSSTHVVAASTDSASSQHPSQDPRTSVSQSKRPRSRRRTRRKHQPLPILKDDEVVAGKGESRRVAEFYKTLHGKDELDALLKKGALRVGRRTQTGLNCFTYAGQFQGQDVVVKEIHYLPGSALEVKLLTDVRFSGNLQHKHVIHRLLCVVEDVRVAAPQGTSMKRKLVTVQPVHGLSLAYALKRHVFHDRCQGGKPKLRAILGMYSQVVDAVMSLHQQGIVHGSIRADSVLLNGGVKLQAVLSDFHMATRLKKDKVKLTSFMMGALGCTPPEMYEGVQVNGSRCGVLSRDTDMYCLGVLLWHAVCRQPAFRVNKAAGIQEKMPNFPRFFAHGSRNSLYLSNAERQVVCRLESLVVDLTHHQPWERPSIFEVGQEIQSLLNFLDTCPPQPPCLPAKNLDPIPEYSPCAEELDVDTATGTDESWSRHVFRHNSRTTHPAKHIPRLPPRIAPVPSATAAGPEPRLGSSGRRSATTEHSPRPTISSPSRSASLPLPPQPPCHSSPPLTPSARHREERRRAATSPEPLAFVHHHHASNDDETGEISPVLSSSSAPTAGLAGLAAPDSPTGLASTDSKDPLLDDPPPSGSDSPTSSSGSSSDLSVSTQGPRRVWSSDDSEYSVTACVQRPVRKPALPLPAAATTTTTTTPRVAHRAAGLPQPEQSRPVELAQSQLPPAGQPQQPGQHQQQQQPQQRRRNVLQLPADFAELDASFLGSKRASIASKRTSSPKPPAAGRAEQAAVPPPPPPPPPPAVQEVQALHQPGSGIPPAADRPFLVVAREVQEKLLKDTLSEKLLQDNLVSLSLLPEDVEPAGLDFLSLSPDLDFGTGLDQGKGRYSLKASPGLVLGSDLLAPHDQALRVAVYSNAVYSV